jgi:hypothetical protein
MFLWISCPRGIVALLILHPQRVESLKKMKKWIKCDPPNWEGQMVETKNDRTLGRLLLNTQKSLWKSLYCLNGSMMICRS